MSFGFGIGDFIAITKLASQVVSGARQACGAHDELTREVSSLHIVLRQLEREVSKPTSILTSANTERRAELATLVEHCDKVLKVLSDVLKKYNGLSAEKKKVTKFWKKVRFGNGEMLDLSQMRLELATHTNVLTMFLNLSVVGSLGKVEEHMNTHGEELREVRRSVNWVTASMQASAGRTEGSVLTSYKDDDKAFWRELRRELVKEGYSSEVLRKHKGLIRDYVIELGDRGALDELQEEDEDEIEEQTQEDVQDQVKVQPQDEDHDKGRPQDEKQGQDGGSNQDLNQAQGSGHDTSTSGLDHRKTITILVNDSGSYHSHTDTDDSFSDDDGVYSPTSVPEDAKLNSALEDMPDELEEDEPAHLEIHATSTSDDHRPEGSMAAPGRHVFIGNPDGSWDRRPSSAASMGYPTASKSDPGNVPLPSRPKSSGSIPADPATRDTSTSISRLFAISSNFHVNILPRCLGYCAVSWNGDKGDMEYQRLSEIIMNSVLLKLDAVDTGYDEEARAIRKTLVQEVQDVLHKLDDHHATATPHKTPEARSQAFPPPPYLSRTQHKLPLDDMGFRWRLIADRYIERGRAKASPQITADNPLFTTPPIPEPSRAVATQAHARKHDIDPEYSLKNWDPTMEPFFLFGSIMDAYRLGKWIYDWAVYYHGALSVMSDTASQIWILLIELSWSLKRAEDVLPVLLANKDMMEDFIESGYRLTKRMQKLVRSCEDPMIETAKKTKDGKFKHRTEGRKAVQSFLRSMLDPEQDSIVETEKWMSSVRLWEVRFESNCLPILTRPDSYLRAG